MLKKTLPLKSINHLKVPKSFTQTKVKLFYCTKFVKTPVKGFCLVKKCSNVLLNFQNKYFYRNFYSFISQEKDKKSTENLSKICHWKLIFVHWIYITWARRHKKQADWWTLKILRKKRITHVEQNKIYKQLKKQNLSTRQITFKHKALLEDNDI